ncbi:MAG TPA: DUF2079 domain-containing protein [Polyangiaceae bacterium]|nr:DUF2079 domain-containing protein [Polyangiaceae bacterium]
METAARTTRFSRWVDRIAMVVPELGIGAVGWPLVLGAGLAASLRLVQVERARHARVLPSPATAVPFLLFTLGTALVALAIAKGFAMRGDSRPLRARYRDGLNRLSFLGAVPLVLVVREPLEIQRGWSVLLVSGVAGLLVAHTVYQFDTDEGRRSFRLAKPLAGALLFAVTAAYTILVVRLAFINHVSMNTGRSDLGYYMSVFRKSSQGVPLGCSLCGGGTHTTGHFDPILVPLSLFYLVYPFAETMLVLQAVWLASGAIPVYRLTRSRVGHRGAALALATAYLAYPALHGVNLFDFHSIALCVTPFLWFLVFIDEKRPRAALLTLGVLLLVREDVAIATSLVGISCLFAKDGTERRIGWATLAVSVTYFLVAKIVFMGHADPLNQPASGRGGYALFYEEMIPSGRSTRALVETVIGDPLFTLSRVLSEGKVDYVAILLAPLLGLPLLARGRVQLLYGFAVTLLATQHLYSVHAQYSSTLVPVMFGLATAALARIRGAGRLPLGASGPRTARALSLGVLVSSLLVSYKFGGLVENETFIAGFRPLSREGTMRPLPGGNVAWIEAFARSLPRGASVAANSRIVPHLGPVSDVYMIEERARAEYVIANMQNPEIARIIKADVDKGFLQEYLVKEPLRIYKTKYPKGAAGRAGGAAAEPDQAGP